MHTRPERLLHKPVVQDRMGYSHATLYTRIGEGLFPKPVKIGPKRSAWPESEVDAMISAHVRGDDDAAIRELVKRLEAARARAGLDDHRLAA
ncbi:MAG: helix-turn-helix transcriptional regulator [Pseudomonadota bacterium]